MGHWFERINSGHILITQHGMLQIRRHQKRPLQALGGEICRIRIHVSAGLILQIGTDDEDQIDIRGGKRSWIARRQIALMIRRTASAKEHHRPRQKKCVKTNSIDVNQVHRLRPFIPA